MTYTPTAWLPGEAGGTLVTAEALLNIEDQLVASDLSNPASSASVELLDAFGRRSSRSVADFGAVADCNGATGTDNLAAFNAAMAATPEGGRLWVPPGHYFFSGPVVMSKAIHLDCGAGGFLGGPTGTKLTFQAGVSGLEIKLVSGTAPSKWRVGPFYIKSLSTIAGADVGVFISAGRGIVDGATVESFGSHGVHVKAGAAYGGGNANNTTLTSVRAYGNRGDGIRLEGTDANACLVIKPDVVANYGVGINLQAVSMCKVIAAHADQQYNGATYAYRDAGNSNDWDWLYSEGAMPFLIDTGSSHGRLSSSLYGATPVTTVGNGWLSWRIGMDSGAQPIAYFRQLATAGAKLYSLRSGGYGVGSFDLTNDTDSKRIFTVDSGMTRMLWFTGLHPATTALSDLGSSALNWRNGFFSSYVRVGSVATGSRPSAVTAGAGAIMVDSTLNKQIHSDGTVWRDAMGTAV